MIDAKFDMKELNRSLRSASKAFGDTSKNAIARWGVSTCRELAKSTQPFGIGGTKKKQHQAIESGMRSVLRPVDAVTFRKAKNLKLSSPEAISRWVDQHRSGRKGHARLGNSQRAICKKTDFNKALRSRKQRAGIAKGAWLGAGKQIAKRQRGAKRINIGKSYLSWTQKHAHRGTARYKLASFRSVAELINKAAHSKSNYVLKDSHRRKAVYWAGRKTLTWYRRATKQALDNA